MTYWVFYRFTTHALLSTHNASVSSKFPLPDQSSSVSTACGYHTVPSITRVLVAVYSTSLSIVPVYSYIKITVPTPALAVDQLRWGVGKSSWVADRVRWLSAPRMDSVVTGANSSPYPLTQEHLKRPVRESCASMLCSRHDWAAASNVVTIPGTHGWRRSLDIQPKLLRPPSLTVICWGP